MSGFGRFCKRVAPLLVAGGVLCQIGSCFAQATPLAISLGESAFLTLLLGQIF